MGEKKKLTTSVGCPVVDNQNVLTAGPRGPQLLQDVWFLEKLAHFDREVISERRMHAKGSGAYGTFTVTDDITRYTRASIFPRSARRRHLFVRFSTVAGERGAADAERDIRGFAVKFYTEEGNWDLVGNNTPVFFLRDPLNFPDLNHAVKRDPRTNMRSAREQLGFLDLAPRGAAPGHHRDGRSWHSRNLSPHARFRQPHLQLHQREARALLGQVPFQVRSKAIENLTDEEAADVIGKDRESHQRDLFESIERETSRGGHYTSRSCRSRRREGPIPPVRPDQGVVTPDYPLIEVGVMELNRNPENYLCGGRTGRVQSGQRGARHRFLTGQDAAGTTVLATATRSDTGSVSTHLTFR